MPSSSRALFSSSSCGGVRRGGAARVPLIQQGDEGGEAMKKGTRGREGEGEDATRERKREDKRMGDSRKSGDTEMRSGGSKKRKGWRGGERFIQRKKRYCVVRILSSVL